MARPSPNVVITVPARLLTRDQAAAYCAMSLPTFQSVCPVPPISLGDGKRMERYDVLALNEWIDRLSRPASVAKSKEQMLAEFDHDSGGARERR